MTRINTKDDLALHIARLLGEAADQRLIAHMQRRERNRARLNEMLKGRRSPIRFDEYSNRPLMEWAP